MDITEFRRRYPAYDGWSDDELSDRLYKKFYQNKMSREDFEKKFRPRKYTGLEKAKYFMRDVVEEQTLGLGDVVAGASNVLMNDLAGVTHGGSLAERLKSYGKALYHTTPLGLKDLFSSEDFKQGRKDFVEEQEEFAEVHPGLSMAGKLAGGLLSAGFGGAAGAAKSVAGKGFLSAMGQGAKEGAKWGALFGAGHGLTEDAENLSPQGALRGTAFGAVAGAPFGAAFGLAGAGINKAAKTGKKWIANYKNKDYNTVAKAAGEDVLQKSIDTQTPLLDIGNSKVAQLAKDVKNNNVEASDLLTEFVEQGYAGQGDKLRQIVSKYMPATGAETAESLTAAKKALSKAAYEPMQQMGELLPNNPSLANLVKTNPQVQRAILTAKKNVPQLPDDGFELFNEAKKVLDDMAAPNPLASGAEKSRIRYAQEARRTLISELDKATGGQYKAALREYGDLLGAEQALNRGRELLNMDPQAAAALYRKAGAAEREGLRVGLAQELQRRIRKGSIDGSARNLASALVGSEQNKQIFRAVLGKDADKFIEELSGVNRAVKNYGIVKGGSDTHSNNMRAEELADLLFGKITALPKIVAGKIIGRVTGRNPQEVAKMMTDPGYLAAKRWAAMQRDINVARRVGKVHFNLLRAAGPLLRKDEPSARVSGKSWWKIKGSPDWRTYQAIKEIPDIYSTGKYSGPTPNNKKRTDGMKQWHWFEKEKDGLKMGLQVGEDEKGRVVYNINAKEATGDPGYRPGAATSIYSINNKNLKIKPFSMRDFMRVLLSPQFGGIAAQVGEGADKKASAFTPRHKLGNAEVNNSIANNQKKNKWAKNNFRSMKDFLILLQRPFTLGLQGNIAAQNSKEGK